MKRALYTPLRRWPGWSHQRSQRPLRPPPLSPVVCCRLPSSVTWRSASLRPPCASSPTCRTTCLLSRCASQFPSPTSRGNGRLSSRSDRLCALRCNVTRKQSFYLWESPKAAEKALFEHLKCEFKSEQRILLCWFQHFYDFIEPNQKTNKPTIWKKKVMHVKNNTKLSRCPPRNDVLVHTYIWETNIFGRQNAWSREKTCKNQTPLHAKPDTFKVRQHSSNKRDLLPTQKITHASYGRALQNGRHECIQCTSGIVLQTNYLPFSFLQRERKKKKTRSFTPRASPCS